MNTTVRIAVIAVLFVLIFLFGFWLSRAGKPYNPVIFTFHKLISLGAVIYLGLTIGRIHQLAPLGTAQSVIIAVSAACFLATIVTGGVISAVNEPQGWIRLLHRTLPYVTALATSGTLYLLIRQAGESIGIPAG